jgi:hypothetical protein
MRLTTRKLLIYAALLLADFVVSSAAALVAVYVFGASDNAARVVALVTLIILAIPIAALVETRVK